MTLANPVVASYPQILFLGDSIVYGAVAPGGYISDLASKYAGKMDLLNRGLPGYNSRQILKKLRDDFYSSQLSGTQTPEIKLVVLHVGTNDSCTGGLQRVDLQEYKSNMTALISHFQSAHKTRIILVTPSIVEPSVWAAVAKSWGTPDSHAMNRTMESAQAYAQAVLEVGKVMHVPVVDAFTLLETPVQRGEKRFEDLLYDGLHYTEAGYSYITAAILQIIENQYPEISPAKLRDEFPNWPLYGQDPAADAEMCEIMNKVHNREL